MYIYTVYIYIYTLYIYSVYIYIQCMYIVYVYIYIQCIYIHIYTVQCMYIYIYVVSGPSGGLHFHMFRGIFYFHIYIYTVYIYIVYIYMYILYITFSCGPSPKSQISLKCAEMSWNSQHSQGQLSRFSEFPRLQCWWNYIFIYNYIYITLSCNLKWKPKTKLWKVVIIFLKKRPVHSENNLI